MMSLSQEVTAGAAICGQQSDFIKRTFCVFYLVDTAL